MKNLKKLIEHIFTKKNIKIFLFLFIVLWFFIGSSFAASSTTSDMTPVQKISYLIHILTSILSRGWVILATLAGKFMTNDFVYGTFLHLDKVLWDLWNVMKNFANITLGLMFIFSIVKNLFIGSFGDKSPIQNAKDTLIHTFIAGVLIQMSWFLIAVLLDLSTIATVAVGSLPSQFMVSNADFQNNMTKLIKDSSAKITVDFTSNGNIIDAISTGDINTDDDVKKILDTITPSADSMVGPLIFLGASVFNLYDLSDSSKNEAGTDDWGDLFLSLGINGFVLFAFSLMLALIFLFNLFRVITLWIVIPLTPFVILLSVFNKEWSNVNKNNNNKNSFLFQIVDYKNILKLVFKPVYMTLVLSIVLIVMVLVKTLVRVNNDSIDLQNQNNMTIQSKKEGSGYVSSLDVANVAKVNMNGRESIVDLLVYFICLALMVMLMKSCVSGEMTGIKFIDDKINNLSKLIWGGKGEFGGILGKTGVIPIGDTKIGLGTMASYLKNNDVLYDSARKKLGIDTSEQDELLGEFLGIERGSTFSSLNVLADKYDKNGWLESAVRIGRSKYNKLDELWADGEFRNAFEYYKEVTENVGENFKISTKDVDDEWNGIREKTNNSGESEGGTSTKTSQSE